MTVQATPVSDVVHYEPARYIWRLRLGALFQTPILGEAVGNDFVRLAPDGDLSFAPLYSWNGITKSPYQGADSIRGTLVHDGLYQLMSECGLSQRWRDEADRLMLKYFLADGMPVPLAEGFYAIVRAAGWIFSKPTALHQVLVAPAPVLYLGPPTDDELQRVA